MKKLLFLLFVCLVPGLAGAEGFPTREELLKVGAQQVQCKVTSVGAYNFLATGPDGREINFLTEDGATEFVPENERLMVGDEVNVIFLAAVNASGSADKIHAMRVEWITKVERKFLEGKITCLATPLKYRNGKTCYVKELGKVIRFEGSEGAWETTGQEITVNLKAVPARIGNGYIYQAK